MVTGQAETCSDNREKTIRKYYPTLHIAGKKKSGTQSQTDFSHEGERVFLRTWRWKGKEVTGKPKQTWSLLFP
jgi:hypothetical protein